jgi:hypothetical protein
MNRPDPFLALISRYRALWRRPPHRFQCAFHDPLLLGLYGASC